MREKWNYVKEMPFHNKITLIVFGLLFAIIGLNSPWTIGITGIMLGVIMILLGVFSL